jgi:hypothetical protein
LPVWTDAPFDKEKRFRLHQENVKAFPKIIRLPKENMQPAPVLSGLAETERNFLLFSGLHVYYSSF